MYAIHYSIDNSTKFYRKYSKGFQEGVFLLNFPITKDILHASSSPAGGTSNSALLMPKAPRRDRFAIIDCPPDGRTFPYLENEFFITEGAWAVE